MIWLTTGSSSTQAEQFTVSMDGAVLLQMPLAQGNEAWAFKAIILRLGGINSYEKSKFFFMGLALGQIVSGGIWLIIDGLTGVVGHRIRVY